ncbi:MAG: PE family protein [Candidatus Nanopelagicales bacterium]
MTLRVVPEGLAATSVAIEALSARLAAARAAAAPLIAAVTPPAADAVSVQAALSLSAHGAEHVSVVTQGAAELARSGVAIGDAAASYAIGDAQAAMSYSTVPR